LLPTVGAGKGGEEVGEEGGGAGHHHQHHQVDGATGDHGAAVEPREFTASYIYTTTILYSQSVAAAAEAGQVIDRTAGQDVATQLVKRCLLPPPLSSS
jgi:hypothetical protein